MSGGVGVVRPDDHAGLMSPRLARMTAICLMMRRLPNTDAGARVAERLAAECATPTTPDAAG